jgi:hypothetical protein
MVAHLEKAFSIASGVLTVAASFAVVSFSAGVAVAQPVMIPAGPNGGCPGRYHPGPNGRRCYLNMDPQDGPAWVRIGPRGDCPTGYYPGRYDQNCWRRGVQDWMPTGPRGDCPVGWRPAARLPRCYPS